MPYASLREFIDRLERAGRLVRVTAPVSPVLEMTEIQTRLLAEGGPAVIFENAVRADGSAYGMPLLANLFGTVERVAWGMERTPEELREVGETLAYLRQPEPPGGLKDAWDKLPMVKQVLAMRPKTAGAGAPCQEVVLTGDDIDLGTLPVQTCWPGEPAPLITWPLVVTKGPGKAREDDYNLGIYRMQITMLMSIVHRITGVGLYLGTLLLAWWLVAAASGPGYFLFVNRIFGSWIGLVILFLFTWALIHHMLGGIRHLVWDTGHGLGKPTRDQLATATLVGSIAITILLWIIGIVVR